jgi:hypothetical protein
MINWTWLEKCENSSVPPYFHEMYSFYVKNCNGLFSLLNCITFLRMWQYNAANAYTV